MKYFKYIILALLIPSCFAFDSLPLANSKTQTVNQEVSTTQKANYSLRKYAHVKEFYRGISIKATQICLKNNIPPASLLAIAALESGWNKGYIGRITGNILSLGTRRGDTELPALRLPRLIKNKQILFDSIQIAKYAEKDLQWEDRPESLKKDYRPKKWAGTPYNLAYFKYHPKEKKAAHIANITDFVTVFIGRKSRIKAYRDGRKKMDSLVLVHGKEILLKEETAILFINEIGGKKNSYNFRKTWPKKVVYIIKNAGLVDLTTQLHGGANFQDAWSVTN